MATAGPGCIPGDDKPGNEMETDLAALMADGELSAAMKGTGAPLPRPPRFCGFGGSGGSFPPPPFPGTGGAVPFPPGVDGGAAGAGGPVTGTGGAGGRPPSVDGGATPATDAAVATEVAGATGSGGFRTDGGPIATGSGGFRTDGGVGGRGGGGGDIGDCTNTPIGLWNFDDCDPLRADLRDSSGFNNHTAFRTLDVTCAPRDLGQAVTLARSDDLVYVPDQPAFGLERGVTVAAWIHPEKVGGVRTIARKRDGLTSAFALLLNGNKLQFVVQLATGRLVALTSPDRVSPGAWTHVAASYDGTTLRLYMNGAVVNTTRAVGQLSAGNGPLLMGNDMLGRRFQGNLDNVWFNTLAASAQKIAELTCVRAQPSVSVTPLEGPAVTPDTPVTFTVSVTNNNSATCAPELFRGFASTPPELRSSSAPSFVPVFSGETANLTFDISAGEETEPGTYPVTFFVFSDTLSANPVSAQFVVKEREGCHVRSGRELTIRDVSVVDDPIRTSVDGPAGDPRTGAWTFARFMERLSPTPEDAPDVTEAVLRTFTETQTINGFSVGPRFGMEPAVLQPWPRRADGKLDLAQAPMRLLAIVNRLDLKNLANGSAGEGRIVFGVLGPTGFPMEFTVILEYQLPANSPEELQEWADAWHALAALPFPSEEYNNALQAITDRFSARGAMPERPNGSALLDLRTNEIALDFIWQLREFRLSPTTGFLVPAGVALTPDASFNGSDTLARFITANEPSILTETHGVPALFEDNAFLGGAVFNSIDTWFAPGVNLEARHKFSLNTCNGCHGGETNTAFLHIFPRGPGQQSGLSGFLTGTTVLDRFSGTERRFSELSRRRQLMEQLVCPPAP
jgi:hypothetical protein